MNIRTTIRKIIFITIWICIGGGMFTLLLAAISQKNKGRCKDYYIVIKGTGNDYFLDKRDIEQLLMQSTKSNIRGKAVASFNLHELENMLGKNTWINDAELYIDNRDILHVTVSEKEPVARIFTTEGHSFYLDKTGRTLPLSDKRTARVPVFTGFPDKKRMSAKDSTLLNDIKITAGFIISDSFWMAQVAQVDITPERKFEMIPVIGNHLVRLGDGEDMARKFYRLMVFYRQVLSKTGFDKYKVIDVQYKGQVVATNFTGVAKFDSVRLRKNIEKLLNQPVDPEEEVLMIAKPNPGKTKEQMDTASVAGNREIIIGHDVHGTGDHKLLTPVLGKQDDTKDSQNNKREKKTPKAVMPKRQAEE